MFEDCACVCAPAPCWSGLLGVLREGEGGKPALGPARAPAAHHHLDFYVTVVCIVSVELAQGAGMEGKPWVQA